MFRIMQYGDLHLERGNFDLSVPPLRRIAELAEELEPDLSVFTGDAVTKRGAFHPEAALEFRVACERIASASEHGLIAIDGNHDVSFDGTASFVAGALADSLERVGSERIRIASGRPRIYSFDNVGTEEFVRGVPVVVAIPTFDRYTMKAAQENNEGTPEGIAAAIVRGLIAEAQEVAGPRPIVVVYHGSLAGAKLGNEQVVRSNIDIPLDPEAFTGADAVLLGHLHRPQEITLHPKPDAEGSFQIESGTPLIYNGATCPLSWGEKSIEPGVVEVAVRPEIVSWERHPLPVVSQMIERPIKVLEGPEWAPDAMIEDLVSVAAELDSVPLQARVRIKAEGPAEILKLMDSRVEEALVERFGLRDLSFVKDTTPERLTTRSMDRRVSIVDAVGHWYKEQARALATNDDGSINIGPEVYEVEEGYVAVGRDELIALATEIEEEVKDEDLDARYDFRPISLSVRNWCQYNRAYLGFDELGGVTMVRGVNTAGKSNLAIAVPFGLYKVQLTGDVLADLIRNGEDKAELVLTFASSGDVYRARWILKRGKKDRTASSTLFFERVVDPGSTGELARFEPAVEGTEKETLRKIAELVGPSSLFFASAFADQGSISELLDLRPAEMKDLLASVLHRDFAARVEKSRDRRREQEAARTQGATVLAEHDREIEAIEGVDPAAALEKVNKKRADALKRKEEIAVDDELTAQVEALVARIATLRREMEGGDEAVQELAEVNTTLSGLRTKITNASEAKGKIDELRRRVEKVERLQKEVESLQGDRMEVAEKVSFAEPEIRVAEGVITEKTRERDDVRRTASEAVKKAERKLKRRRDALASCEKAAEAVDETPCRGEVWSKPNSDGREEDLTDMSSCPAVSHAKELAGDAPGHRKGVAALEGDLTKAQAMAETAGDELDAEITRRQGDLDVTTGEVEAWTEELKNIDESLALMKGELSRLGAPGTDLAVAEQTAEGLEDLEHQRDRLLEKADRLAGQVESGAGRADEVTGAEQELKEHRETLQARADERTSIEELLVTYASQAARYEEKLARLKELTEKRDGLAQAVARSESEIGVFNLYEAALGRDGVPFLLLELYALPELQARANAYLASTDWRIQVESERSSVTAGLKPGVYVSFTDWRGKHPVSAASGAQEVAIGSALRQAISDLHANATGTTIRFSVQDEGFGAFDQENLKGAMETIQEIARAREVFFFVSHIPEMESAADHLIDVIPSIDGSEITIDGEANG